MNRWFFYGIVSLTLLLNQPLHAQKEGSVWLFGTHAGLDFKELYPKPLAGGQINSPEGAAAISDANGNLLFYTDGQTVYNSLHEIMTFGTGLNGNNTSTQSSVIVPWPNHPGKYYVFTVGKAGNPASLDKDIYYSIVDLTLNRVDPVSLNIKLLGSSTEKITAIRHQNGVDWWILAHQVNTFVFHAFLLSDVLERQDDQVIGTKHQVDLANPNDQGAKGYLKTSPKGDLVALANEGNKFFDVFKFDNNTGKLLNNPAPVKLVAESAFGVEFSPAGKYLYGSNRVDGMIYRWKLDDFSELAIKGSREIIFNDPDLKCGALQLAPNGKIYIAWNNKQYLGVINAPDLDSCALVVKGASLLEMTSKHQGISGFGLPNIPSAYFKNDLYYSHTCANDTTVIYLASNDMIDVVREWRINGILIPGEDKSQLKYVFRNAGDYKVRVSGLKNGNDISFERIIRIHPLPELNIQDTTYLCIGYSVDLYDGDYAFYGITDGNGIYSDLARSISQPGSYTVSVTNYQGCTTVVPTEAISKPPPEIENIAITQASCDGSVLGTIRINMKGDPTGYHFHWSDTADLDTNFRDGLLPGKYSVGISLVNGCELDTAMVVGSTKLVVKIERSPAGPSTLCPGDSITLTATGAETYVWKHAPGIQQNSVTVYPDTTTTYLVTGSKGECSGMDSVRIEVFPKHPISLGSDLFGCAGDVIVLHAKDYAPESLYSEWAWSIPGAGDSVVVNKPLSGVTLTVRDTNGCSFSDSVDISFNPTPGFAKLVVDSVVCFGDASGKIQITLDDSTSTYEYSKDNGVTWQGQSLFSNLIAGDYSIIIRDALGCTSQDSSVTVGEPEPLTYEIKSIPPSCPECTDGEIRISVTGGNPPYSFNWDGYNAHDSVFSQIGSGNYSVTVSDRKGCPVRIEYTLTPLELVIPNAFSPNGGSKNEKWMIRILDNRPDCQVQVYDRSGKLVFYDDGYYDPWDGTYLNNGRELPSGTYFYLILIDRNDTNKPPQRGTVTILR